MKPVEAFYNGEVAYDLNGFYLFKRYNDNISHSNPEKTFGYIDANTLDEDGYMTVRTDGEYEQHTYFTDPYTLGYLEDWYADGDFIYAGGYIPEGEDERYVSSSSKYYPIWPDDYLFFGQMLTYDYVDGRPHEDYPSFVNKNDGRLLGTGSNRVYRAPAYFQSSEMSVAHFNPDAVFAKTKKNDATVVAYPNMTAIDFTGYNDAFDTTSDNAKNYQLDRITVAPYDNFSEGAFCPPLLDDDGLTSFTNVDLTKNLLVYIPQSTGTDTDADTKTFTVVTDYLEDPTYTETDDDYRTVATSTATLHGHRVVQNGTNNTSYTAPVDHFLVDKNDFNAPISYTFEEDMRMWYQRVPTTYVDLTKGWEGISIPFSPKLVTTQTKGEITHFYSGSTAGHEYWLRGFDGIKAHNTEAQVDTAKFVYLAADVSVNGGKDYTNTFFWDYYYSKNPEAEDMAGQDENTDEYQKGDNARKYYSEARSYNDYPYAEAATPYIIGFPGATYYEFDLSGNFVPQNTYQDIAKLAKQTITFASDPGITIEVSDSELSDAATANTFDNYVFTPNYLSKTIDAGAYTLKSDGSAFKLTSAATTGVPFRPYFTATASSGAPKRGLPEEIVFSNTTGIGEITPSSGDLTEGLNIFATQGKIVVESYRKTVATVRILTPTGITIRAFALQPGERVETTISSTGIYIVNTKKLHVGSR